MFLSYILLKFLLAKLKGKLLKRQMCAVSSRKYLVPVVLLFICVIIFFFLAKAMFGGDLAHKFDCDVSKPQRTGHTN